jgi:uncharacterized protein YjiS (DUF1127 family)
MSQLTGYALRLSGGNATSGLSRVSVFALAWGQRIAFWIGRARQRRTLCDFDERLLRDVGITPMAAKRECVQAFWR